jgi:translation initiation factor 3 subunit K
LYNPDVVINILAKALTQTAHADFNLCLALLDDRPPTAQLDEPDPLPPLLPQLTELHTLLEQCRFPSFWAEYRSDDLATLRDNYTVEVVGFEDAVRDTVVRSVKMTFTRIGLERLGSYLDLEGEIMFL